MNNKSFKVAIYARLSQQDKFTKESESIKNQIELAKIYCIRNELTIKEIYIDDGYTGSNFERPNFKRMIEDIKLGKINTVITKDLSRLGRNLLGSGYYLEDFFPQHKVRYISINDNYDSFTSTNDDMIVLKNCINDLYVRECKKKTQHQLKRRSQNTIMATGFYGYRKENNTLIIDPTPAAIVKEIFERYTNEEKIIDIINDLNQRKVYSPGYYKQLTTNRKQTYINPYNWTYDSIITIIHNQAYCGDAVNLKNKKGLRNKNTIILENKYEPIISKELFNKAQQLLKKRNKANRITPQTKKLTGYFYYNNKTLIYNVHTNKQENYYVNHKENISINEKHLIDIVYQECLDYYNEILNNSEYIKQKFIEKHKPVNQLESLKKQYELLIKEQEQLIEKLILGQIDKDTYTLYKDIIKEKILYNEEQQYKQKELQVQYKNDFNNFMEFITNIKNINSSDIGKIPFIKILSTKCIITKENKKIKLEVIMREQ